MGRRPRGWGITLPGTKSVLMTFGGVPVPAHSQAWAGEMSSTASSTTDAGLAMGRPMGGASTRRNVREACGRLALARGGAVRREDEREGAPEGRQDNFSRAKSVNV